MQRFKPSLFEERGMSHGFAAHSSRRLAWRVAVAAVVLGAVALGVVELRDDLSRSFLTVAPEAVPAMPATDA
jgi:hypothetical protein